MGKRSTLVVLLAALAVAAAGCEEGEKAVAYVGDTKISREQLDEAVEHFQEEAAREGKDFPAKGTQEREAVRRRLLGLLAYRVRIDRAASRMGVAVSNDNVEQRLSEG